MIYASTDREQQKNNKRIIKDPVAAGSISPASSLCEGWLCPWNRTGMDSDDSGDELSV